MRCEEADHHIAEYIAGSVPAGSPFLEHLAECSRCREEVDALRKTWNDLDQVTVPRTAPVMQPRLLTTLAAVREEIQLTASKHIPEKSAWRKSMPYILTLVLTILGAGAAFFVAPLVEQPTLTPPVVSVLPAGNDNDRPYRGAAQAPVTLTEYVDYQCPPCAHYNPILKELLAQYGDKVRLEVRHFPLTAIHPNALQAALVAEAAGVQGRYWEMNDLLFESQQKWARTDPASEFIGFAVQLGLDQSKFAESMRSKELQDRVAADARAAQQNGVSGTPTFFINGSRVSPTPATVQGFMSLIDSHLKTKQ